MTAPRTETAAFATARLWAASQVPYLASALFACTPVPSPGTGTIAADRGWRLHYDPDRVAALDVPELGKLLVHLAGHLIRDHGDRADAIWAGDERAEDWQRCADAEINDDLATSGLLPPVARTVPADLGARDGRLAEEYFGLTDLKTEGDDPRWDCGSAADGQPRPWDSDGDAPALNREEADRLRRGVAEEIRRSHERNPGSVPGGWLGWAEAVLRSTTDWRRVMAAEIRRAVAVVAGSVDYTYRRPSRRSTTAASPSESRVVLPTLYRPVPEVAIVCDTSGSMDEFLLAQLLAEVDAILSRAGLRGIGATTLAVDTAVHAATRVRRAAEVKLLGGGGTDMGAGIAAAMARRPKPELIVVLTDGYTPWPTTPPRGARVVIGIVSHLDGVPEPPPWVRVVHIPPHAVTRSDRP